MSVDLRRLRPAEVVVGASGVALIALLFVLKWYEHGSPAGHSGWHTIAHLRWVVLGTGVIAIGTVLLTATQRSPALPVAAGVLVTVVGVLAVAWLVYRVLITPPGANSHSDVSVGAYLSLVAGAGVVLGGWWSIRDESPGRIPAPPPGAPGSSTAAEIRPAPPAGESGEGSSGGDGGGVAGAGAGGRGGGGGSPPAPPPGTAPGSEGAGPAPA